MTFLKKTDLSTSTQKSQTLLKEKKARPKLGFERSAQGVSFEQVIGINMVVVLGKYAWMVVGKATATPASLKIFTLKSVFWEVIGVDRLWFWGGDRG
jgi:hypothetical protein